MKITLNREYATRHLGVAILFAALCGWFLYDGSIQWPAENAAWERRTGTTVAAALAAHPELKREHEKENRNDIPPHWPEEIARQHQFAGICALAACLIAGLVGLNWKRTLEWDDTQMNGSLTGGKPLLFTDIVGVEDAQWEKKGILVLFAKDGRRVTLDAWHHAGVEALVAKILPKKDAEPKA